MGPGRVRGEKGEGVLVKNEVRKEKWSHRPSGHSRSIGEARKGSHKQPKEPGPCDCSEDKASGTQLWLKKGIT